MTVSLHGKYFKVLAKFSQFGRFLSSNIEKQGTLSIFMLTEQNTYKNSRVCSTQGNLTAMYSFNCCFIPRPNLRPAFKTCIIHCSHDESLLIIPIFKKDSTLWNIYWTRLQLKVMGHCFIHWQRIPRKEKFPKSYITGNAVVFLAWSEISWRAFFKQRPRNRFRSLICKAKGKDLVGKSQARAELTRKCTLFAKIRLHVQEHAIPLTQ